MPQPYSAFLTTVSDDDGSVVISKVTDADIEYTADTAGLLTAVSIDGTLSNTVEGDDLHAAVSQALAQAYRRPESKVETVADLTIGMIPGTRVRVTTKWGIHEGPLDGIRTSYETDQAGSRVCRVNDETVLEIGGSDVRVELTDKAEVVEG